MKILSRVLMMLLSLELVTGLSGCAVEKGVPGQKVGGVETPHQKPHLTDGKYREKSGSLAECASEKVVVENNYLRSTEKSPQTYLNNKQNLTTEEQFERTPCNTSFNIINIMRTQYTA
ncbi:hypothetical protein [Pantoea sp.]|uniref:hypothetical protein n=1 Tax=Pantoea sp. TaxID=69393 RepID=UPI0031D28271